VTLDEWAVRWRIPAEAITDLRQSLFPVCVKGPERCVTEADAQAIVRLEASRKGGRLYRNNVGVMVDKRGVPIRYGLANESPAMNAAIKSADLIGIKPILITPAHVGATIGQFVSREIKRPGSRYTGTPREVAQLHWAELILSLGGDAAFATGEGTL